MSLNSSGRPPRGYTGPENPMIHDFEYQFKLDVEDETKNSTICTLFRQAESVGVQTREVNPAHGAFAEDAGALIFQGSIVPRISVTITARLNQVAHDIDSIQHIMFKWMPIYTAFINSLDAENVGLPASDIETILELKHDTDKKDVYPLFSSVDLVTSGLQPLSLTVGTEIYQDYGLTGNANLESVAFDEQAFWDAKRYYSNRGMLNKVTGPMRSVYLDFTRKSYVYSSNNFTAPIVKRSNPYTFCGILFHCPQAGELQQVCDDADVTTSVRHISIGVRVNFNEWNVDFDQTAI